MTTPRSKTSRFFGAINNGLTAMMAAPFFGDLIRNVGTPMAEKALKSALGTDTVAASKDTHDENLFIMVLSKGNFSKTTSKDIRKFRDSLKKLDKQKQEAFVLFVAKIVDDFKTTIKTKKGSSSRPDYSEGIELAVRWLEEIMSIGSFDERVEFLENEGVFQLIPPKKEPLKNKVKKFGGKVVESSPVKTSIREVSEAKVAINSAMDDLADWLDSKSK